MARQPEQRRPVLRLIVVALAIGLALVAVIAALVWRPLISSLHLDPAPAPAHAGHALAIDAKSLSASPARAP
ncbi:MAG TPA: hypothetical protein VGS97_23025 [Actinocrinis sp.]|uniref:hypothetical protein n=1 Tax=Actinocrinis sp. TaxID=1920516 RepID=UPI002DDC94E6|nr:hypothetical protein [Actinocrinis sp.]HEV2346993.1 hypothetical protein [Actinocrinis sp.]